MNYMTNNKYEQKVRELEEKYCPYRNEFTEEGLLLDINALLTSYDKAAWGIFGAGFSTDNILKKIDLGRFSHFTGFLDNNRELQGTNFHGFPVIAPSDIPSYQIKSVAVSIYNLPVVDEIQKDLQEKYPDLIIHDMFQSSYRYQGYRGREPRNSHYNYSYMDFYVMQQLLAHATLLEDKKKFLEILIERHLNIRDFLITFDYIDQYISLFGTGHYDCLKTELEEVLLELRQDLQKRTQKDIFMVLLDALGREQCYNEEDFPFLNKLAEKGLKFEKAYSTALFTSESLSSVWKQKPVVRLRKEGVERLPLKEMMSKHHYFLQGIATTDIKIVSQSDTKQSFYQDSMVFDESAVVQELPLQFWWMLTSMAEQTKPCISWLHAIAETHPPYHCGKYNLEKNVFGETESIFYSNEWKKYVVDRIPQAFQYVDQQCEFYLSMLGDHAIKIIFADHGAMDNRKEIFSEEMLKKDKSFGKTAGIPLIIHGGTVKKEVNRALFSLEDMPELLEGLIDGNLCLPPREYVQVGFLSIRSEALKKIWVEHGIQFAMTGFNLFLDQDHEMQRNGAGGNRYFSVSKNWEEITEPTVINQIRKKFEHLFLEDDCYDSFGK